MKSTSLIMSFELDVGGGCLVRACALESLGADETLPNMTKFNITLLVDLVEHVLELVLQG